MSGVITRQDWDNDLTTHSPFTIRDTLLDCEMALLAQANELFQTDMISFDEFINISNDLQRILDFAAKISSIGFTEILTDMQQPAQSILKAIKDLESAAARIKSFQKFFDILSRLVRIAGIIVSALATSTTGGAVASIGSLVTQVQGIVDAL